MSLLAELKRRNVLRAAAFYAASAWLLVQVATQVFPFFHVAEWVVRWIVIAAIIGFPFALLFSWFYEWTPHGIQRESEVAQDTAFARQTGKKLDRWIIAVLTLAVVLLLANTFVVRKDANAPIAAQAFGKSIAVLPFANESGDKDELYFSDGLSEDLITALSQLNGLKVISRNSSFQFRDTKDDAATIGKKLGVAHLLEGSVRRAGDSVRVSAELVNVADGTALWSQHYDRPYKDLFKLQDDITTAVAGELKAKLLIAAGAMVQSDRPPSGNLDAYNAYLQGKFYLARDNETDVRKAIDFYNVAIRLDPRYAQAYAARSSAWSALSAVFLGGAQAQQAFDNARASVDTALRLDPELAAAHLARGRLLRWADFDWFGAEAEFRRALQLAPNDGQATASLAQMQATLGHPQQALELIRQALTTDSLSASNYYGLSFFLMSLGRLDQAEQAVRKVIELQPTTDSAYAVLTGIEVLRGDAAAALATALRMPPGAYRDTALANARQIGSDRAAADAALKIMIDKHADGSAYQIAETYALRKDPDHMFEWLDRAWANRDPGVGFLLYDAYLAPYKGDLRFAAFCRKVGLPTPVEVAAAAATNASSAAHASAPAHATGHPP